MTSFIIDAHLDRKIPPKWNKDESCTFCRIIDRELPSSIVFENEQVIAILDILPLRKGHTLVIPKTHVARLSELPPDFAAATGAAVSKVANALTQALEHTGLNVVANQEYAQIVPHVHYHIIPAPRLDSSASSIEPTAPVSQLSQKNMHRMERSARDELDDDVAEELVTKVKAHL
ncbi:hypothetical protein D9611_014677 [Ephemerocybe angulata]|uniref:HIT domain-containing protein n=1 Tax=Ephemerocybe angulata TaxID=980116 RepID=A0A8H5B7X1_9AGAR|nr:hypothetical protein D9611_014677 [Tulosesus angulatus]